MFVLNSDLTVLATVLVAVLPVLMAVLTTVLTVLCPDRSKWVSTVSFVEDFCQYGPEYGCQYTYPAPLGADQYACLLLEKLI